MSVGRIVIGEERYQFASEIPDFSLSIKENSQIVVIDMLFLGTSYGIMMLTNSECLIHSLKTFVNQFIIFNNPSWIFYSLISE